MIRYNDIIGQEEVKQILREQIVSGKIPHAQLFYGPEGVGKMAMALSFASTLLCQHPVNGQPCGQCTSCKMMEQLEHPDLHFVFPVLQSKEVSDQYLEKFRAMLLESPYFDLQEWHERLRVTTQQPKIFVSESERILNKISLTSQQGGYKVMIIYQPERMMAQAANKLLKILEEPTPRTVFLLVSDAPEQLLTTIVSRTQRISFRPLTTDEIRTALIERNALGEEDALRIARLSGGSYTRALQQIHIDEDTALFFDLFALLMRLAYQRKIKELSDWSDQIATWGRERQKHFLEYCQHMVRENFIYNFRDGRLNYMSQKEQDFAVNFARFINERNVYGLMQEFQDAQRDIAQNGNAKMVFFDLTMKVIILLIK